MKPAHLVLSFWLATLSFCVLQILFGPTGISETLRLQERSQALAQRLAALQEDHLRLSARYEALRTSVEEVRLEARALGWFGVDEVPVRTFGSTLRLPADEPDLSTVPREPAAEANTSFFFRIAWPLLFFLYCAFFVLASRLWPSNRGILEAVRATSGNLPVPLQTGLDFFRK